MELQRLMFCLTLCILQSATAAGAIDHLTTDECSLTLPPVYVLFACHLKCQIVCHSNTSYQDDHIGLTLVSLDRNLTKFLTATTDQRPSPTDQITRELTIACGVIDRVGQFLLRASLTTMAGHVTVIESKSFVVTWPKITLRLQEGHVALSSDLVLHAETGDVLCDSSSSFPGDISSGSGGYQLQLLYLGLNPDFTNGLPRTPDTPVNHVHPLTTLSQLESLHLMLPCSTIDQAGFYLVTLISNDVTTSEEPIALSNRMRASWSPAYNLALVDRVGIFPCPEGSALDLRYTQPLCYNPLDKVRLYRQVARVAGSIASPVDLVYIAERRADAMANVVRFPCEVFDTKALGYCFKYVSTANSGSVREQRTLCVPVKGYSGSVAIVDGQWSSWSTWTSCSSSCGPGFQSRFRTCDNPVPSPTGKFCEGNTVEAMPCDSVCRVFHPSADGLTDSDEGHCGCGCEIFAHSSSKGQIFSTSRNCSKDQILWHIRAPRGHVVQLTYDLEVDVAPSHRNLWVIVRDGQSLRSTTLGQSFESAYGQTVRTTQEVMLIGLTLIQNDQSEGSSGRRQPISFKAKFVILAVASNKTLSSESAAADDGSNNDGHQYPWQTTVTVTGLIVSVTLFICIVILICHRRRMRSHDNQMEVKRSDYGYCLTGSGQTKEMSTLHDDAGQLEHLHRQLQQPVYYSGSSSKPDSSRKDSDFRLSPLSESRDRKKRHVRADDDKRASSSFNSSLSSPSSSSLTTRSKWQEGGDGTGNRNATGLLEVVSATEVPAESPNHQQTATCYL